MNRHPTHPSQQCECETCELEFCCEADTRLEFAVNPHTGSVIAMWPFGNKGKWHIIIINHREDGATLSGWRGFDNFADAFDVFWVNAEHAPPTESGQR